MNSKTEPSLFDSVMETNYLKLASEHRTSLHSASVKTVCTDILGDINPESFTCLDLSGCTVLFPYSGQHGRNLVNCCVVSLDQYCHVLCMCKCDWGGLLNLMKTK